MTKTNTTTATKTTTKMERRRSKLEVSSDGSFKRDRRMTWNDYQFNMLKVQKLMTDKFDIASLVNNKLGDIEALAGKLGIAESAETD